MKPRSMLLEILLALLFSIAPPAVAVALAAPEPEPSIYSGTREVRLEKSAVFDGEVLPAGLYSLSWGMNRDRERVEVRLYEGRRMLASATGRLVERDAPSAYDSIAFSRARTGDRELAEIRFAGTASVIALAQ